MPRAASGNAISSPRGPRAKGEGGELAWLTTGQQVRNPHSDPAFRLKVLIDDLRRRSSGGVRHHRPSHRTPDPRNELLPFHSITSSARTSKFVGMVRPSALAVLRLMTNSNLVGWITGRSPGFSPLRMRPIYTPTCRSIPLRSAT
jgi:hypothetical protein